MLYTTLLSCTLTGSQTYVMFLASFKDTLATIGAIVGIVSSVATLLTICQCTATRRLRLFGPQLSIPPPATGIIHSQLITLT